MVTPYPVLDAVLQELVQGIGQVLVDNLIGAYLQGSFALGDFDIHSDVDFVVVIRKDLSEKDVGALNEMHGSLFELDSEWAKHLEGSYFTENVLRHCAQAGKPLWYLDHGSRSLVRSDHCNMIVVRWILRECGVTLTGPPPATLIDPIPVDRLRAEIRATISGWGGEILGAPERFNNRFYQGYLVLNFCRMLHDLRSGRPGSKVAGARWAKANLDKKWAGLIDRAWSGRPNPAVSVRERADPTEFAATLEFLRYVIGESEAWAAANALQEHE